MVVCSGDEVGVYPMWIPIRTVVPPRSGGDPHPWKAPVTTPAPPMPRHRAPLPAPATPLSRSTWRRVRRMLTIGVFVVTTAAGVTIGLNGATVSPVAPAVPALAAGPVAPAPVPAAAGPVAHHGHGPHR